MMLRLLIPALAWGLSFATLAEPPAFQIGAALALTGNAAPFGTEELRAVQQAADEVNAAGKIKLELLLEDTNSSGLGTVQAVKGLVEVKGVKFIIGPTWLDSFQGALPVAESHQVLLLTPSAGISNLKAKPTDYPLVFSTFFNFEREIVALVEHAARSGRKKIGLLFDQDPYFQAMRRLAADAARRLKLELVFDADFAPGERDFRSLLLKVQKASADALIFGSVDEGSVLSLLKQRRELAPKLRILGTHDLDGYSTNQNFRGLFSNIEYVVPAAASARFREAYQQRYAAEPLMSASNAYDAVKILTRAIESGCTTAAEIADYLKANEFETATFGPAKFSAYGGVDAGEFEIKQGQ